MNFLEVWERVYKSVVFCYSCQPIPNIPYTCCLFLCISYRKKEWELEKKVAVGSLIFQNFINACENPDYINKFQTLKRGFLK